MDIARVENGMKYLELLSLVQEELSNWQKEVEGQYGDLYRLYAYCLKSLCYDVLDEMKDEELIFSANNELATNASVNVTAVTGHSRHNLLASYEDFLLSLKFTFTGITQYKTAGNRSGFETDPNDFKSALFARLLSSFSITQEMSIKRNYFGVQQIRVRTDLLDNDALKTGVIIINSCIQFSFIEKKWQEVEEEFFLHGNYIESIIDGIQDIFPANSFLVERCSTVLKQMWLQRKVFHLHKIAKSSL